jgi:hypothetical protein
VLKLSEALGGWRPARQGDAAHPLALLQAGWEEIVGAEVAQNSVPTRIAAGMLTVTTRSSAWSHQLSFLSEHVLRAVGARLPGAGIHGLRFRVGRLAERRSVAQPRRLRRTRVTPRTDRQQSANASETLARFRKDVEDQRRKQRSMGWTECGRCGALLPPRAQPLCSACVAARREEITAATARLLFEAPWLGRAGTIALVRGLQEEEYEQIRTEVLSRWWRMLVRARALQRLSRDGRERLIASSYVLLQSKLPPEQIMPATLRSILGDELHDLLYSEV